MKFRRTITALSILALILVTIAQVVDAQQSTASIQSSSLSILSNVFNLDLTKYEVILNRTIDYNNSPFGPKLNQQTLQYTLFSSTNTILVNINYRDNSFWFCNLEIKGTPIYAQTPSADILTQSKSILQRYQAYVAQNSTSDISYLSSMSDALNTALSLHSSLVTTNNAKLNITGWTPDLSNLAMQSVKYFYSENGLDAEQKAVTLEYNNGLLTSISDTWNRYTIGSLTSITKDEALKIAWSQAQNFILSLSSNNGSTSIIKPDLSNATTEVSSSMQPRGNSNALYPYWHVTYYFAKPYYQDYGIVVTIWGDTKQVISTEPLVMLGGSNPYATSPSSTASVPEFSWVTIIPLLLFIPIVLITVRKRLQRNVGD